MRLFAGYLLLAACGPHNEPPEENAQLETVPPPSAVPASPRIPAEESPPVATTDPPDED